MHVQRGVSVAYDDNPDLSRVPGLPLLEMPVPATTAVLQSIPFPLSVGNVSRC